MRSLTTVDKVRGEHRLRNACIVQHSLCELAVLFEEIHTWQPSAAHLLHLLRRDLASAQRKLSCKDVSCTGTTQAALLEGILYHFRQGQISVGAHHSKSAIDQVVPFMLRKTW